MGTCWSNYVIFLYLMVVLEETLGTYKSNDILGDENVNYKYKIDNISTCAANVENIGIINLQPLERTDGYPRFYTVHKNEQDENALTYNYTFNPCSSFNEPKDPFAVKSFGGKCFLVSVCKFNKDNNRFYFYKYGIQQSAKFVVIGDKTPMVALTFRGAGSMTMKMTVITLKCDRNLRNVDEAKFEIIEDDLRLGIKAELSHICCCPNACINGIPSDDDDSKSNSENGEGFLSNNGQSNSEIVEGILSHNDSADGNTTYNDPSVSMNEDEFKQSISSKLLTIVGVNVGVLLLAGVVASMCYVKRSHLQIYYKLPGVQTNHSRSARYDVPSMDTLLENGLSGSTPGPVPHPVAYRDYEPENSRPKKSIQQPLLDDCQIANESITLGQRLGGGLFGDTHVGVYDGLKVAVTRITVNIHDNQITPESLKAMTEKVWFLSRQRHRNIVSMLGLCIENRLPYIISEFVEGESVKYYIQNRGDTVTWPQRMKICLQVADGMAYLHSTNPPILHRDLRCANLFISSHDIIKVGDFGLVKLIQPFRDVCNREECSCQGHYSACPSSIRWTAPEVLEHPTSNETEPYITASSDVYSFGISMWELFMCEDPFDEIQTNEEVVELVKQGQRPELSDNVVIMPQYRTLMKQCWNGEPESRPTFKQIATRSKELIHQSRNFQKAVINKQRLKQGQQTIDIKD